MFSSVRRRPEMFGVPSTFRGICAFVQGADAGNEWQLLAGFREFLVVRADKGPNLTWTGLALHIAFPGNEYLADGLLDDPGRERHAIDTLLDLLDEFLERRSGHGELVKIFDDYLEWRRSKGLS